MSIVLQSSGGGSVTIQEPVTASNLTATLPAATGTVMVSGNMPAFSAYNSTNQAIANGTFTKVSLQVEEFDTANAFDATTNYRFTPQVAGYYQLNAAISFSSAVSCLTSIYKNGSEYKRSIFNNTSASMFNTAVSCMVYLNGSTDYVEFYVFQQSGISVNLNSTPVGTWFQGVLVRSA